MKIYFAPLEGITYPVFRKAHSDMFPGVASYFSPFLAPDREGTFKPEFLQSRLPDNTLGIPLVPQLLANDPSAFNITAGKLQDLGYEEVNLNVGCPSATVFSKHKGAGMLQDLASLDRFLDAVYARAEKNGMRLSIKTRLGIASTDEFPPILEIYNRYPVSLLIIHARDREGQYRSVPDVTAFSDAFKASVNPVCYNGEIFSPADLAALLEKVPALDTVMIGRGAVANPALTRELAGGEKLTLPEMRTFHDRVLDGMLSGGLAPNFAVMRMKELWFYMSAMFPGGEKLVKALNKSRSMEVYCSAVSALFSSGLFSADAAFPGTRK